jgi:hypothetical protein
VAPATSGTPSRSVSDDEEPPSPSSTATVDQAALLDMTGEDGGDEESVAVAGEAERVMVAVLKAK